jgi:protein TonB
MAAARTDPVAPSSTGEPSFTPREVEPSLRNRSAFAEALERRYPRILLNSGISGTTVLWAFVDVGGRVRATRIHRSSGNAQLDHAAETALVEDADFSPALNRDQPVGVWVQIPVTFALSGQDSGERADPPAAPRAELAAGQVPEALFRVFTAIQPVGVEAVSPTSGQGSARGRSVATNAGAGNPASANTAAPAARMDVRPALRNRDEFTRTLRERYPPALRNAGIGGTTTVWVRIDTSGKVLATRISRSSGNPVLDMAAQSLIQDVTQWSPAQSRGAPIAVWVAVPVTFSIL